MRVTLADLSRLPAERLAQLLMEAAIEDSSLLARLHASITDPPAAEPAPAPPSRPAEIIGQSPPMRQIVEMIERFGKTEEPVLITGESGTGKELVARAIHDRSTRHQGPFVAVNCAAIPSALVASELFGHEKGAFTGATGRTRGQIEHADGGTLFLDEIGDMPIESQGHLLRFLQERQIVRVGGRDAIGVDVRIVAATNVRLRQAMAEGRFREDLFYRLDILGLPLPPLRERGEDVEALAGHFLHQAARQFGRQVTGFAPEAMAVLRRHTWPGNVRELMAVVRRAVVITDSEAIMPGDLVGLSDAAAAPASVPAPPAAKPEPGSDSERTSLLNTLAATRENITLTALELGVSRVTLYRMLRRHAIMLKRGLKAPPMTG